jgi:hypothetical protein
MLAYLDDLDSKVEAMQRLIAEPNVGGDWTRISPMFERPIYRHRTLESPKVEATAGDNQTATAAAASSQPERSDTPQHNRAARSDSFNTPFEQLGELFKGAQQ